MFINKERGWKDMLKKILFITCCFLIITSQSFSKEIDKSDFKEIQALEEDLKDLSDLALDEIEITEAMLQEAEDEEDEIPLRKKLEILYKYVLLRTKTHLQKHKNKYVSASILTALLVILVVLAKRYHSRVV